MRSKKSAKKGKKRTSTRDNAKLNKQLKEESSTIQDVVPKKKSIPNVLTHSVSTQVYPDDVGLCPIVCNVTKEFEPFKIPTIKTEDGYTGVRPFTSYADDKSSIGAVTNHTQDNLNISPVAVSSTDKFKSGPVIGTKQIKLEGVKSDANSDKPEVSSVSYHNTNSDGSKVTIFSDGEKQFTSADGMLVKVLFVNGDMWMKDYSSNIESYYFASNNSYETKHSDGRRVLEFPNGQTETFYPDGTKTIRSPDGTEETYFQNGVTRCVMQDGTTHMTHDGNRLILFKNGQKELQLKMITICQYPDGITAVKYPNGNVETFYLNGRRRMEDKFGKLVYDTGLI